MLVHGCIISRACMHPKRVTGAQRLGWTPARAPVISEESGPVQAAAGFTHMDSGKNIPDSHTVPNLWITSSYRQSGCLNDLILLFTC